MDIDVLGSYNTLKATIPYLIESAAKHKSDGVTRELPVCNCLGKIAVAYPKQITNLLITTNTASPTGTGGRIIFVSATIHYTGIPLQTHVAVAKAGVDSLSNNVAIEYGPRGVNSNILSPGPIGGTEVRCPGTHLTCFH